MTDSPEPPDDRSDQDRSGRPDFESSWQGLGHPEFRSPDHPRALNAPGQSFPPSFPRSVAAPPTASFPVGHPQPMPYPAVPTSPSPGRRRGAGIVVVAALVALVVGGGAGYAGVRLGQHDSAGGSSGTAPAAADPNAGTVPSAASSSAPARAAGSNAGPIAPARNTADAVRIAQRLLPSTVTIRVTAATGGGLGSGFVLDQQGRIMTNNHVVADAAGTGSIQVTFADGHRAKAVLLGRSPGYDLAVIQVDDRRGLHPVSLGDSSATRVGEPAIAIGSPLGLSGTVTEGIISAVDRPVAVGATDSPDGPAYLNALQTDAPINRGNSGGPLVNGRGEVIGVNSAILTGSDNAHDDGNIGIGFAIPIDQARQIGQLLIDHGHASYPVINATVTDDSGGDGVVLSTVVPGGAADRAGLRSADVVTAVDGRPVGEVADLVVAIRNHRPGDTVTLHYRRNGHTDSVTVKLAGHRG